jgi:hypothetical protein
MPEAVIITPTPFMRMSLVVFVVIWCGGVGVAFIDMLLASDPTAVMPGGMLAFGGFLTARMMNLSVRADTSGLSIRNMLRSARYDWGEVEDFRFSSASPSLPIAKTLHVLLRNGEILTLDVTSRLRLSRTSRRQLDDYLRQLRSWTASP